MANLKNQITTRIMQVFDKLILTKMSEKVQNRQLTNLAQHFNNLMEYMSEEDALKMIECYKNHPLHARMLTKYEVLKQEGYDKALDA